jgi:hypothetical protein
MRIRLPGIATRIYRSARGLWFPEYDEVVERGNNCLALLLPQKRSGIVVPGSNIVTDAGDVYIAQRSAGETPTNGFTTWEMASAGTPGKTANRSNFTPITGSQKVQTTGYPKTNDTDPDNTGGGTKVRTTSVSYTGADFSHSAISHALITNASPGASEPILAGWAWASAFAKASTDSLKCFHNVTMNGV